MGSRGLLGWAPVAGLIWVVLVIISVILGGDQPGQDDPISEFVKWYQDSGNRDKLAVATVLAALGGIVFLWFLAGLRDLLLSEEGVWGWGTSLAFGAGVAFTVLLWAAAVTGYAFASAADFFDSFAVNPITVQTALVLSALSFWFVVFASVAAGVLIGASAAVMFATGVLPRWLAWVSAALAVLSVIGALFAPGLPALVWVLVLSVAWLARPRPAAPAAAPAAAPGGGMGSIPR
jgi:hypothetical protein